MDPGLESYIHASLSGAVPPPPDAWPPSVLDLPTLTLIAWYFSPDLAVSQAEAGETETAEITAQQRPNPSVSFSPVYTIGGPPWGLGLSLDVPIETANKRSIRRVLAQALTTVAHLRVAEAAWQVRRRLRAQVVELGAAEARSLSASAEVDAQQALVQVHERLVAQGLGSGVLLAQAHADLSSVRVAQSTAMGEVRLAKARLGQVLGLPIEARGVHEIRWDGFTQAPTDLDLSAMRETGLRNRLDLRRLLAQYAGAESALQLEVAKQYPDIHLGPGWSWNTDTQQFTLGVSFNLPLNGNRGPIAEAAAQRRTAAARFIALQAEIIAGIDQAVIAYRTAVETFRLAERQLDDHRELLARAERAVAVGTGDSLVLAQLQLNVAVAQRARVDALHAVQRAVTSLEDAVQQPLVAAEAVPIDVTLPTTPPSAQESIP